MQTRRRSEFVATDGVQFPPHGSGPSTLGAPKQMFDADTDVFVLGDDLLKRGVRQRYLAQKGPY